MKKHIKIIIPIGIVFSLIIALFIDEIYWAFFDIQRIEGREVIQEITSPNDNYTILSYAITYVIDKKMGIDLEYY